MSEPRKRLGLLISGRGSNLRAFIDACHQQELDADIGIVISNRPNAAGLLTAAEAGIATHVVDHKAFPTREAFDMALAKILHGANLDLVILAGFMRILTPAFVNQFRGRLLNIHPSLLPLYPGLDTHQRAIDSGDSHAGATVHYVTPDLDGGPPILHAKVDIRDDTAESLAERILPLEHVIYPAAAKLVLSGSVTLGDDKAYFNDKPLPPEGVDWQLLQEQVSTHGA